MLTELRIEGSRDWPFSLCEILDESLRRDFAAVGQAVAKTFAISMS